MNTLEFQKRQEERGLTAERTETETYRSMVRLLIKMCRSPAQIRIAFQDVAPLLRFSASEQTGDTLDALNVLFDNIIPCETRTTALLSRAKLVPGLRDAIDFLGAKQDYAVRDNAMVFGKLLRKIEVARMSVNGRYLYGRTINGSRMWSVKP